MQPNRKTESPPVTGGPRARILAAASELFYRQGYGATGINQILTESGTHKASLYRYFPAKEDLGLAYLRERGSHFGEFLERLLKRSRNVADFASAWTRLTLREAREARFYGCPLANFRGQSDDLDPRCLDAMRQIIADWLGRIAAFLVREQAAGRIGPDASPARLAGRLLKIYQGSAQLYRLTGDPAYLEEMAEEMLAGLRPVKTPA